VAAAFAGSAQAGQYLFVIGGFSDSLASNFAETRRYDMENDEWVAGPDLLEARGDLGVAITDKALYVIGGDATGGGQFDSTDTLQRLEWADWPAGTWTMDSNPPPVVVSGNDAGFCTNFAGSTAIWSVAGGDTFSNYDINLFRFVENEKCVSIYQDVPWLTAAPASGSVGADSQSAVDVTFDTTGLTAGTHQATLVLTSNDRVVALSQIPVTLEVIPAQRDASLTPDETVKTGNPGEQLTYTVTVVNEGNIADTYDVSVNDSSHVQVSSPTVGPLDPGESDDITVTVTVPSASGGGESYVATVQITSQGDNTMTRSLELTATANNVFSVAVDPDTSVKTTPGSAVTYTLSVANRGNVADTYGVAVSGNQWTTTLSRNSVPVARGATETLTVTVTVPPNQIAGATDTATITVTSQGNAAVNNTATLITVVDRSIGAIITPTSLIKVADAGQTVQFTLEVKNIGNAADIFDLTVTGATWQTTLSATTVGPLNPGATTSVDLTVHIPRTANPGDISSAVVTAKSRNNPSITGTAAAVTRVLRTIDAMSWLALAALAALVAAAGWLRVRRRRLAAPRLG
jgi:uncharacterized membrane protein